MNRKLFTTADGSTSFRVPDLNEQYHSKHGAIQEARHVFIESGLRYFLTNFPQKQTVSILEIGFGTGLNSLLTALYCRKNQVNADYTGIEAYPITKNEWKQLNYPSQIANPAATDLFEKIYTATWGEMCQLSDTFAVLKQKQRFENFHQDDRFDLIYFDAFGAQVQPELWETSIFKAMFKSLHSTGILVTYSAKGSVKRAMQACGFKTEKIPGPPGKREMLRALKTV